jgi:hypothetical protein
MALGLGACGSRLNSGSSTTPNPPVTAAPATGSTTPAAPVATTAHTPAPSGSGATAPSAPATTAPAASAAKLSAVRNDLSNVDKASSQSSTDLGAGEAAQSQNDNP